MNKRVYANALRMLSVDAVELAQSGHPGAPLGLADIIEVLWCRYLKYNPNNPQWINRDRFILSNGHASMLLYGALHLAGYEVTIEDLKQFRRMHSKTPGHPEYKETPGVETTTGPLGQGFANAVGMALSEKMLANRINRSEATIIDHRTWVVVGDGCLMEGISHEAASLAGVWELKNLVCLYDDNGISIDGEVSAWFKEDIRKRFEAYGWRVIGAVDGHDQDSIEKAFDEVIAPREDDRPTLVIFKTHIGYGSGDKQDSASSHGSPLGESALTTLRNTLDWELAPFELTEDIYQHWNQSSRGNQLESEWQEKVNQWKVSYPELHELLFEQLSTNSSTDQCLKALDNWIDLKNQEQNALASRQSFQKCLSVWMKESQNYLVGSADLSGSNGTLFDNYITYPNSDANYIYYGVREFGMTAIANGIALHGHFIPMTATFLVFMEYARNAVRLASLMEIPQLFVYTHDSVLLGEDGPTHQPIEQLAILRATPNLDTWRPCDEVETAVACRAFVANPKPLALILSRQKLTPMVRSQEQLSNVQKGGYLIFETEEKHHKEKLLLLSTGSEVAMSVEVAKKLASVCHVRVISLPCTEAFLSQSPEYQQSVLPDSWDRRVIVEAAHSFGWHRFIRNPDRSSIISIDRFGLSGKGEEVLKELGISEEAIYQVSQECLLK